jgi:hypothetical protein
MKPKKRGEVSPFTILQIGLAVCAAILIFIGFTIWSKVYALTGEKEDKPTLNNYERFLDMISGIERGDLVEDSLPYYIKKDYYLLGFNYKGEPKIKHSGKEVKMPDECKGKACLCLCRDKECKDEEFKKCRRYSDRIDKMVADREADIFIGEEYEYGGEYLAIKGVNSVKVIFVRKTNIRGDKVLCFSDSRDRFDRKANPLGCFE